QLLLGAVMDVPLDPTTLAVLRRHETLTRRTELLEVRAQLLGQPDVPQDESGLRGQILDQLVLRGGEGVVRRLRDGQRTQELVSMADRGHLRRAGDGGEVV